MRRATKCKCPRKTRKGKKRCKYGVSKRGTSKGSCLKHKRPRKK